jgi:hypothetical protein
MSEMLTGGAIVSLHNLQIELQECLPTSRSKGMRAQGGAKKQNPNIFRHELL